MKKEAFGAKQRQVEMKRDRNESDEWRLRGEDGSCLQDGDDLPTAPSEQPTSAQGAHQEAAPPTAGGEQRSVEEQVGWGREPS